MTPGTTPRTTPEPQPSETPRETAPPGPAAKAVATVRKLARRVPFTATYVVVALVLAISLGTLWSPVEDKSFFPTVSYGLPALQDGNWLSLLWGCFFALNPVYYVYVVGFFAVLTGFAEWKLGTRRTVLLCFGYQFASVLIVALVFWLFKDSGWEWAVQRGTETDVGFSAGMLAVLSVATATVRPPWRLRLRLAIWTYVLFSIIFIGQMADAEHLVAVALSLPFSIHLAGPRALRARALPTRHEIRLIAMVGLFILAIAAVLANFLPEHLTPFGWSDYDDAWSWYYLVPYLVLALLLANGLRRGYRWAWWVAVVATAIPVLAIIALFLLIGALYALGGADDDGGFDGIPEIVAVAVMFFGYLGLLIAGRSAFKVPRRSARRQASGSSHPDTAKELLRRWGGSPLSWMTTWPENRHFITADGQSYLAFRRHAGVAVVLGDPVGPPGSTAGAIEEFLAMCEKASLIPYFFSCSQLTADVTDARGWQKAQVAEDNLIDLPPLEFKGKKWQDIRTALNKGGKEGITFRMVTLSDEPWAMVRQVEHLSQQWLGDKELPEMGFTLGGVTEALDPEVRVGLAVGADGKLHGVTSWMPVYAEGGEIAGWTLDLMRRADGGFRNAMEFLIASSCLHFKAQGARFVSLSGAPLARSDDAGAQASAIDRFLATLGETLEPVYGFRSLHMFKAKFQPRLSPMLMTFRDEGDLPRIGIAITRAYLPTAGLRDMLAVVRH